MANSVLLCTDHFRKPFAHFRRLCIDLPISLRIMRFLPQTILLSQPLRQEHPVLKMTCKRMKQDRRLVVTYFQYRAGWRRCFICSTMSSIVCFLLLSSHRRPWSRCRILCHVFGTVRIVQACVDEYCFPKTTSSRTDDGTLKERN